MIDEYEKDTLEAYFAHITRDTIYLRWNKIYHAQLTNNLLVKLLVMRE